jgi:hypothetical protein
VKILQMFCGCEGGGGGEHAATKKSKIKSTSPLCILLGSQNNKAIQNIPKKKS